MFFGLLRLRNLDYCADRLELALGIVGSIFADGFQNFGAGGLGHFLGLFQAQAGQLADDFDDFNLLRAGFLDHHIELGLFFDRFSRCNRSRAGCRNCHRGSRRDTPGFLELFHQLGSFKYRELAQLFNEFIQISPFNIPFLK
jgi:hypothetical protein